MRFPTIVINAYNRPKSIKRLLSSLDRAHVPQGANLVFSIEHDPDPVVLATVQDYAWGYGTKEIILQPKQLGVLGHFMYCGALTQRLGDIVYLEDDLFVGTAFYSYAQQALAQYADEDNLAGFSLNALWFNGYLHTPFTPIDDGNASFFLQVPWYQGQIYTARQWAGFQEWYDTKTTISDDLLIHEMIRNYKLEDDWFPIKTRYLVESGKYYCFPRVARVVNFGDEGAHFANRTDFFQTELSLSEQLPVFMPMQDCKAVYDSFFELIPDRLKQLAPHLQEFDVSLDLNASKDLSRVQSEFVISSRRPQRHEHSYGLEMRPHELNVIYEIEGQHFYLARPGDFKADKQQAERLKTYFNYHYRFKLSKVERLKVFLGLRS